MSTIHTSGDLEMLTDIRLLQVSVRLDPLFLSWSSWVKVGHSQISRPPLSLYPRKSRSLDLFRRVDKIDLWGRAHGETPIQSFSFGEHRRFPWWGRRCIRVIDSHQSHQS